MPQATSNTVYGIIFDAMHDAGLLGEGDEPNSEQLASNLRRLNDIVNLWQTQGLKLFLVKDISVALSQGQSSYSFGPAGDVLMPAPIQIWGAYIKDGEGNKVPLRRLSWNEWTHLQDPTESGLSFYHMTRDDAAMWVYLWGVPSLDDVGKHLHIVVRSQAANPENLEESTKFPQEWRIALRWALADDICTGQPEAIMQRCASRANVYREVLEQWDTDDGPIRFGLSHVEAGRFL